MIQPLNSGKQINSQFKTKAFLFDCSDPNVNFTDGIYTTNIFLKEKAVIHNADIKYLQDLSAYPAVAHLIRIRDSSGSVINNLGTPVANNVNEYSKATTINWGIHMLTQLVAAGNNITVGITGMSGSGIDALSFVCIIHYTEMEV